MSPKIRLKLARLAALASLGWALVGGPALACSMNDPNSASCYHNVYIPAQQAAERAAQNHAAYQAMAHDRAIWHVALAFSPSSGAWAARSERGHVQNTDPTAIKAQAEQQALQTCGLSDCQVAYSDANGVLSAVVGMGSNGVFHVFTQPQGISLKNLLGYGIPESPSQRLLQDCRQTALECHVIATAWTGGGGMISFGQRPNAFGAVAMDEQDNRKVFAAGSFATRDEAEARAKALCQAGGGSQCSAWYWFANSCTAVVTGQLQGRPIYNGVQGPEKVPAMQSAHKQCEQRGARNCQVVAAACAWDCDPRQTMCTLPRPQRG